MNCRRIDFKTDKKKFKQFQNSTKYYLLFTVSGARSYLHKENYLSNSQNQHVVGPELKLLHLSIKPIFLFNMLYYFQIEGNHNQELLFFPL